MTLFASFSFQDELSRFYPHAPHCGLQARITRTRSLPKLPSGKTDRDQSCRLVVPHASAFPERPWLGASLSLSYPSNYLSQTRERQDRPHMTSSKHGHGLPRQCFWSRRVQSSFSKAAKPSVTTVRRCYLQQALWPRRFKHTMGALAREYTAPKRCVALHMKAPLLR